MSIFDLFSKKNTMVRGDKEKRSLISELTDTLRQYAAEDREVYPDDTSGFDEFLPLLTREIARHVESGAVIQDEDGKKRMEPVDSAVRFYLPEDRMTAYACILPPLDGGRDVEQASFLEDLRYEGVTYGIDQGVLDRVVEQKKYLHLFPVARGKRAVDGEDGVLSELFERKEDLQLEVPEGSVVDFSQKRLAQIIRQGEIICQIKLPVDGSDGMDVTGRAIRGRDGVAVRVPSGANTKLSSDRQLLLSTIDGVVSTDGENFIVKRQKIIIGDLDETVGSLNYLGNIYIGGNVSGGVTVEATGNVVIQGEVREASIVSGGSIRIQRGVKGDHKAILKATRQVQCSTIEQAAVEAGESVFAEVIMDSQVTSGNSIYVLGGRGLVLGGNVQAKASMAAKKIGNLSDYHNRVAVGYSPGFSDQITGTEKELEEAKVTLEKLRKNVSTLRIPGDQLSLEKRTLLARLVEQKTLYENQVDALTKKLKGLKQTVYLSSQGRITCDELYPVTEIFIGEKTVTVQTAETNCSIHVYSGRICLK